FGSCNFGRVAERASTTPYTRCGNPDERVAPRFASPHQRAIAKCGTDLGHWPNRCPTARYCDEDSAGWPHAISPNCRYLSVADDGAVEKFSTSARRNSKAARRSPTCGQPDVAGHADFAKYPRKRKNARHTR